ncbi:MAG: multidrug efflux RND transporter permease subunit [Acidobacteriota bacterium]
MIDFFIKRPIFATVCSLIIILVGAICIPSLPIEQYPTLAPPQVSISTFYNGASSEVVESAVTTPLEQQINGVEGMKYITSSSGNDGSSTVTVTFDSNRNVDEAAVDVQNRVAAVLPRLPNEVKQVGVNVSKSTGNFILAIGLYADKDQYDTLFMSNYADRYIRDSVSRVRGVGNVLIFGERKYAMRIWLDPGRMTARHITADDVVGALREQNIQVGAGQVGQSPAPKGQPYQISIRAIGRLADPEDFANVIVKKGEGGDLVRIRDIGRTELGAENYNTTFRFNGHTGIGMGVLQLSGANALTVDKQVLAVLKDLSKSFPPGLKYTVAFDATEAVSESVHEVVTTLLGAILLVVAVIFLFLQTGRSTIIPAITIPVSLIGTFAFVKIFGFSINTLTLFGLTLATGLVVDDAIVVIENIERFIAEKRMTPREAASAAMAEVSGAVVATTLVLIAVFVPVAFFPGTTGIVYRQFSLTIAFSVALSAFNALTLTPALSALLLRLQDTQHSGAFFRPVNRAIDGLRSFYSRSLRVVTSHKALAGVVMVVLLALGYWLFRHVPSSFVPAEDQGYFFVLIQAPEGSSLEVTDNVAKVAAAEIRKLPEIGNIFSVTGFSFGGSGANRGMLVMSMKPWSERTRPEQSVDGVINRLRGPLFNIPGALIFPFAPPAIQGVGSFGGFQFVVEDRQGSTPGALAEAVGGIVGESAQHKELQGLFSSFTANDPQLLVTADRDKAKSLGISIDQIFSTLQVLMGSSYVNDFDFANRAYRVYVQSDEKFRASARRIGQYNVRSDSGEMVPLESLVKVNETVSPQTISHYNLFRSAEIDGSAAPGFSTGSAMKIMEQIAGKVLPQGFAYEWTGLSQEEIESGRQTAVIFLLSLVFVFLVLSAQYESFVLPLIIMLGVPFGIVGALAAQASRGLQNDIFFQVGLVMLIGLSSKNAILIVEFAEQLREKGNSVVEAALEAAAIRLRPILMTSLAFILGVAPLLVASGAGKGSRHSLGTAVFGGMIVSTVLNLYFIPVLYIAVETMREGVTNRRRAKRESKAAMSGEEVNA